MALAGVVRRRKRSRTSQDPARRTVTRCLKARALNWWFNFEKSLHHRLPYSASAVFDCRLPYPAPARHRALPSIIIPADDDARAAAAAAPGADIPQPLYLLFRRQFAATPLTAAPAALCPSCPFSTAPTSSCTRSRIYFLFGRAAPQRRPERLCGCEGCGPDLGVR